MRALAGCVPLELAQNRAALAGTSGCFRKERLLEPLAGNEKRKQWGGGSCQPCALVAGRFVLSTLCSWRCERGMPAPLRAAFSSKQLVAEQRVSAAAKGHSHRAGGERPHKEQFHTI